MARLSRSSSPSGGHAGCCFQHSQSQRAREEQIATWCGFVDEAIVLSDLATTIAGHAVFISFTGKVFRKASHVSYISLAGFGRP